MKRILTIDGGGIKGIYAASMLAVIEQQKKIQLCDYFDLIAGTSTGGIIAAALSVGIPAQKILDLYLEYGAQIFPSKSWKLLKGKYKTQPLKNALESVFQDKKIVHAKTRLLIPAYNLETDAVRVFKTPHSGDLFYDKDYTLCDILLATTAAPIYFSPHKMRGGTFIDGGIGANNPSLIALVEGVTRCKWSKNDIVLLNIGSVNTGKNTTGKEKMGLVDFLKIQQSFMNAENQFASNICRLILEENYIRVSENVQKGEVGLDNVKKHTLERLKVLGEESAKNNYASLEKKFLLQEKEPVEFGECSSCDI